jgi:predicted acetyltransferase
MLRLELPNESHKEIYENLWEELEWCNLDFIDPDNIYAFRWEKYSFLLENIKWDIEGTRKWRVPANTFFWIDNGILIWAIQIRHHIDHPNLIFRGWHIGYGVRPSERKKWYATKMLFLALAEAWKIGLKTVLITVDIINIASNKVIVNNWWILEKECLHEDGTRFNRYWITL